MNKKTIGLIILGIYFLSLGVFIFFSLQSGDNSSEQSSFITDIFYKVIKFICGDKIEINYDTLHSIIRKLIGHFGYCVFMGILLSISLNLLIYNGKIRLVIIVSSCLLVSIFSEFLELIPESRGCSVIDMGIDSLGHLLGIGIIYLILFLKKRKKSKNFV